MEDAVGGTAGEPGVEVSTAPPNVGSSDNNSNNGNVGVAQGIVPEESNRAVRTTAVATASNGRRVILQQGNRRRVTGGMHSGFLLNQQGLAGARQRIVATRSSVGNNNGSNDDSGNSNQTARTTPAARFVVPNGSAAGTAVPTLVQPTEGMQPSGLQTPVAAAIMQRQRQFRHSLGSTPFGAGTPIPTPIGGLPMHNGVRGSLPHGPRISLNPLPPLTPMPVLEPQPIPHQPTGEIQFRGEKPPQDFECPICYQYLDDPSSCGHCESRFCYSCLATTRAHETSHRIGMPNEPNHFKCPCCRRDLRMEDVQKDHDLKRLMDSSEIRCPYEGCAQPLKFSQLKAHEQTCPAVVLKCKYAPMGCAWTGQRKSLQDHLSGECAYARVGGLIQQMQTNHQSLIQHVNHLQHQLAAVNRFAHQQHQSSMVSMASPRNVHSIGDIIAAMYNMMCHPVRFHHPSTQTNIRQQWRAMFASPRVRATVCHHLRLVPTGLLVARIFFSSIRGLFTVADLPSSAEGWDIVVLWIALENVILAMAIAGVTVLLIVCLHIDGAGPTGWRSYDLTQLRVFGRSIWQNQASSRRWPMLRDVSGVACAAIHLGAIEYFAVSTSSPEGLGGQLRGHFLWYCVCLATTLFPRLVDAHLRAAALVDSGTPRSSSAPMVISHERTRSVALFGLRYGFFFASCHPIAVAEAILVRRLLEVRFGAKTTVVGTSADGNTTVTTTADSTANTTTFTITTTTVTTTTTSTTSSTRETSDESNPNPSAGSNHASSQTENNATATTATNITENTADGVASGGDGATDNTVPAGEGAAVPAGPDTNNATTNASSVSSIVGGTTLNVTINENEASSDAPPNGINLAVRVGDTPVNVAIARKESFVSRLLFPLRDTEGFFQNLKSVPQMSAVLVCRLAIVVAPFVYAFNKEEEGRADGGGEAMTVRRLAEALCRVIGLHLFTIGETIATMMIVDHALFVMTAAGDIGSNQIFAALAVSQQSQRTPVQPEEAIGMAARVCSPLAFCTWATTLICILLV